MSYNPIPVTAATMTLDNNQHGGAVILANRAAGTTFTLPAATGSGAFFKIVLGVTVTSNSTIVQVANSTDVMTGTATNAADGGDTLVAFETAAASDTITLNGTTTGGTKGDQITLEDVASGLWSVAVRGAATGTEATPFSAAV
jgi:hypothetical protein